MAKDATAVEPTIIVSPIISIGPAPGTNTAPDAETIVASAVLDAETPPAEFADASEDGRRWEATLTIEGVETVDGRFIQPGALDWRDPPLTLMVQFQMPETGGHALAFVAGRIDSIKRQADGRILAAGVWDEGVNGREAQRMVGDGVLNGISVDLGGIDADVEENPDGSLLFVVTKGIIMGGTVVNFPAFDDADIHNLTASAAGRIAELEQSLIEAGAYGDTPFICTLHRFGGCEGHPSEMESVSHNLAASTRVPLRAPKDWYFTPEANEPTPITITDDGQIFGHIALWNSCHTGYQGQCVRPPRGVDDYAGFMAGRVETAEGELINVAQVTYDTDHAPLSYKASQTKAHYDDTGAAGADVRIVDGKWGPWISGAVREFADEHELDELRRIMLAHPPSGDWRQKGKGLELCAILCVNRPGFPVVASIQEGQPQALLASMCLDGFDLDAALAELATRAEGFEGLERRAATFDSVLARL